MPQTILSSSAHKAHILAKSQRDPHRYPAAHANPGACSAEWHELLKKPLSIFPYRILAKLPDTTYGIRRAHEANARPNSNTWGFRRVKFWPCPHPPKVQPTSQAAPPSTVSMTAVAARHADFPSSQSRFFVLSTATDWCTTELLSTSTNSS